MPPSSRPVHPVGLARTLDTAASQLRLLEVAGRCRRGEEPLPITEHEQDTVAAHLAKGEHRPAGTIWRPNPREQGLIGLTDAIAWFGAQGWDIALPLIDSQPYDLVVDDRERLYRVQVKTTRPGRLEVGSSSRSAPTAGTRAST